MTSWLLTETEERELDDGRRAALTVSVSETRETQSTLLIEGTPLVRLETRIAVGRREVRVVLAPGVAGPEEQTVELVSDSSGRWSGTALGERIDPTTAAHLRSGAAGGAQRAGGNALAGVPVEEVADALARRLDVATPDERVNWKCWRCTAKCTAIATGLVAACAALTGPAAHICAAGAAAQGIDCQNDCPC